MKYIVFITTNLKTS
jgi:hypothetical protein